MKKAELVVALDVDGLEDALRLREELDGIVDFFKVGKELFTAVGPRALAELAPARIFLDLKFHDIPATVAGAVRRAATHGVAILDVHASGGSAMMRAAAAAAAEAEGGRARPLVFGVTVLTHLDDEDLSELGIRGTCADQVRRLARLARVAGLDGIVGSALEIETVLEATEGKLQVLVPGVRPSWASATHDQKRVTTPGEAARRGASYVVVGRAITQQSDRRDAARRVVDEIEGASA